MVHAVPIKTRKAPERSARKKPVMMRVLEQHERVELVDDERGLGNGIIVTMKEGWTMDPIQDNRVFGADTIKEALETVRMARPFAGPYTT